MLKWLWRLLWPKDCEHQWELLSKSERFSTPTSIRPNDVRVIYRCTKCGKAKRYKL